LNRSFFSKLPEQCRLIQLLFSYRAFLVVSALLLLYAIVGSVFLEAFYTRYDIWDHIAQIIAFRDSPFSPVDPYINGNGASHLMTPYHFLLGIISKLSGLSPLVVFTAAGVFNLVFFLYSVKILAEKYFGDKNYSLTVLVVFLFGWLFPPLSSGYYNFGLIPLTLGYPYRFVFPFILLTVANFNPDEKFFKNLSYLFIAAFSFAIHPLSGAFIMLIILGKTIFASNKWSFNRTMQMLLPVFALLISFLWQFYPIASMLFSSMETSVFNLPDSYKWYYTGIWSFLLLLPPSLITFYKVFKENRKDWRVILFVSLIPVYILNFFIIKNEPIARFTVFTLFLMHLATIEWMIRSFPLLGKISQHLVILAVGLLALLQFPFSFSTISVFPDFKNGKPLGYYSNFRYYNEYSRLDSLISDNGVILAPVPVSTMIVRVTHQKTVVYYYPNPAIPGTKEKSADIENFFSASSIEQKRSILKKYGVDYIITADRLETIQKLGVSAQIIGTLDGYNIFKISLIDSPNGQSLISL